MRVAIIQHDIEWEDAPATRATLEPRIAHARAAGAELVVLTEMFATGFSMAPERVAEPPHGPTQQWLTRQARTHGVHLVGSVAQHDPGADRAVNRALLVGPDGTTHHYDKIHPFTYSGEHEHYAAGTEHRTIEVHGLRLTLFICYDLRFADEFWATAPVTDCYVVVANWPVKRREHWRTLLRARATENQAWVIAANRVGDGDGLHYAGDSAVIDPTGTVLVAAAERETVLLADVDAATVTSTRAHFPFLTDRRASRTDWTQHPTGGTRQPTGGTQYSTGGTNPTGGTQHSTGVTASPGLTGTAP